MGFSSLRKLETMVRINRVKIIAAVAAAIAGFCFAVTSAANAAGEPKIDLALGSSQIALGEGTSLMITLGGPSGASEPALPEVDGLDMALRGRTQSVRIMNMEIDTSRVFRYAVMPHKTGAFTIGPAEIQHNGQTYKSGTVQLLVTGAPQSQQPATAGPKNVIFEAGVDNLKPYVGQQINLILRLGRRTEARIGNADFKLPDMPDFWNESLENRREYTQRINSADYLVTEVAIPLFPIKEGDISIDPITIGYDEVIQSGSSPFESPFFKDPFGKNLFDDDFFKFFRPDQIARRSISSRPLRIHVRPLPLEGRPAGFKGGVGSFNVTTLLSNNEVKAGESVTLTVTLSGEGNIRQAPDPELNIEGVKAYSDTPAVSVKNYHESVVGEKVYKLALVPQQAGEVVVPKISIPYFNPRTGRYEVAASPLLTLKVLPSQEETVLPQTAETQRPANPADSANRDILPIHERIGSIESDRLQLWLCRLRPVAYPLPVIVYALCFVIMKRRERLRTDTAFRRYRFALKTAEQHLEKAAKAMSRQEWADVFTECSRALNEYLADKLDVTAAGLTTADIKTTLASHDLPENLSAEIIKLLESCDYGRFTSTTKGAGLAGECLKEARRLISILQEEEAIKQ